MKKTTLQISLITGVSIELIVLYKMFETSNEVYQQLFSGLAVCIFLILIKSLTNLTENNHGNQKI